MTWAKPAYMGLAWLFVLALAVQFFLAGLGVLGGESIEAHRQNGFATLHLLPILMLLVAIFGKLGRKFIILTIVLFVLVFLQALFADPDLDPMWLRSLHVLNAFFITGLAYQLASVSTRLYKGQIDHF